MEEIRQQTTATNLKIQLAHGLAKLRAVENELKQLTEQPPEKSGLEKLKTLAQDRVEHERGIHGICDELLEAARKEHPKGSHALAQIEAAIEKFREENLNLIPE